MTEFTARDKVSLLGVLSWDLSEFLTVPFSVHEKIIILLHSMRPMHLRKMVENGMEFDRYCHYCLHITL